MGKLGNLRLDLHDVNLRFIEVSLNVLFFFLKHT